MKLMLDPHAIAMLERMAGIEARTKEYWQREGIATLEQTEFNSMVLAAMERLEGRIETVEASDLAGIGEDDD